MHADCLMVGDICVSDAVVDRLRLVVDEDDELVASGDDEVVAIVGAVGVDG